MVDLHTHTNESDGTCTPLELVDRALAMGLEALAISDHDTFAGYDQAAGPARAYGLDPVGGEGVQRRRQQARLFFGEDVGDRAVVAARPAPLVRDLIAPE